MKKTKTTGKRQKQDLTFKLLRKKNLARCEKYFHSLEAWSETDWGCALSGEVGELCNFLKKRKRVIDESKVRNIKYPLIPHLEDAKKEIGDIIAYVDLVAARLELRLEDCVTDKFNEVSERKKCRIKL